MRLDDGARVQAVHREGGEMIAKRIPLADADAEVDVGAWVKSILARNGRPIVETTAQQDAAMAIDTARQIVGDWELDRFESIKCVDVDTQQRLAEVLAYCANQIEGILGMELI